MSKKTEDFSEWYNDIIEDAGLIDKRYPVKGMDVWMPYGLKLMRAIDTFTREEMARTGHDEVEFPLLVPESLFAKESDHIKGFEDEVYWVRHGGLDELEVPLVVRPTSETAMYPMFALWIRAHTDLPFKIFQIVNVFRYDTKQTRSFMRVREIHFFEAHTAHEDYESAEEQVCQDLEIWENLTDKLCLPSILAQRPEWDKFPGAHYTIAADVLMPEKKTLQCATFHHYKTNFAEPYEITYEAAEGEFKHVHQTTYGMSERLVGAIVGLHGDEQGLRLPPDIAPIQVAIVPVIFEDTEADVLDACQGAAETLREAGIRVELDDTDETAGFKYHKWEQKGVPLRLEIGPRDLENDNAVLVPRDGRDEDVEVTSEHAEKVLKGSKVVVPQAAIVEAVEEQLKAFKARLRAAADRLVEDNLVTVKTVEDARHQMGVLKTWWCGEQACAEDIETNADRDVLGFPRTAEDGVIVPADTETGSCISCGARTDQVIYLGKSY